MIVCDFSIEVNDTEKGKINFFSVFSLISLFIYLFIIWLVLFL